MAAATLVAAVPAGVLAYLLVGTFLTQLGHLSTTFTVLAAATLLCCAVVVFLPFSMLIFGPRGEVAPKPAKAVEPKGKKKAKKGEPSGEVPAASGEIDAVSDSELMESAIDGPSEFGEEPTDDTFGSGEMPVVEGSMTQDGIGVVDAKLSEADMDAFVDDLELEEEPKPKKKK